MIIQSGFFQQHYHVGCAFNLHSIINSGLILGGQNSCKRQTVFFLPIDPRGKGHQDLATIDFNKPRRAQYMHSAWKKHQDAVFWVDINLAIQKGLTFNQTRSNAISSISWERDVSLLSANTSCLLSCCPDRSQIGLGLDWVGFEESTHGASPKDCRTTLPSGC